MGGMRAWYTRAGPDPDPGAWEYPRRPGVVPGRGRRRWGGPRDGPGECQLVPGPDAISSSTGAAMPIHNASGRPGRREPRGRLSFPGAPQSTSPGGSRIRMTRALRVALFAILSLSAIAAAGVRSAHWGKVRDALSKGLPRTAL